MVSGSIGNADLGRRQRRDPANAFLEAHHPPIADVVAKEPGKCAVSPRVHAGECAVAADHVVWPGHDGFDVRLVHRKAQHHRCGRPGIPVPIRLQQVNQCRRRIRLANGRDLGDGHAVVRGIRAVCCEQDALG